MADYIVVAGEVNRHVKKMFEKQKEINIKNTFNTVQDLIDDVIDNGTSFLQVVKSVFVLDYGFTVNDSKERARQFIYLQDTLKSNSLRVTKLYLITKDTNLYADLRGKVDGVDGIHYLNTEVLLIEGEYAPKIMSDIFRGGRDKMGLYHPEVGKDSLAERMLEDGNIFIQDSRSVSTEILMYGKDEPVSKLSRSDFMDSSVTESAVKVREREELDGQKRRLKNEKKLKDNSKDKIKKQMTDEPKVREMIIRVREPEVVDDLSVRGAPNLRRLKSAFNSIGMSTAIKGKLEQDEGVISFIGERKSGVSGVIANLADIYGMSNRSVLVIDADLTNRSQTLYFGNYDEQVERHYGVGNGLVKVTQGGTIQRTAVQITSRVSVLGVSRKEVITEDVIQEVASELGTIIEDARTQYDIVLVDIPSDLFGLYVGGLKDTDKNIWVLENRWYDIENFIKLTMGKHLMENEEEIIHYFKKSSIILNKFKRGRYDGEGQEIDRFRLMEMLRKEGFPYDVVGVAGEIPYYDDWEDQYVTRVRYIWTDELAMGVYKQLFSKVVW